MENNPFVLRSVAVLGGTGKEGKMLAYRWARAGYKVFIGSRSLEKGRLVAKELMDKLEGKAYIEGLNYKDAVELADIIVLTVPYSAHRDTLENIRSALHGKILIDVTVPLNPPEMTRVHMPSAGSAAQEAAWILGEGVEVCTAFQNISYENLLYENKPDCEVLVTGTSKRAREQTLNLVFAAGFKGWDAGPIENSLVVEGLTSILININKQNHSKHAGIKITGVDNNS